MSIVCSAEKLVAAVANRDTWTVKRGEKPRSGNLSAATERFYPLARPKIGQFPTHREFAEEFPSISPVRRPIDPEYLPSSRKTLFNNNIMIRSEHRLITRSCLK